MEYGLIGEHLGHSYSKEIHEKLIENYTYEIHPVKKDEIEFFMQTHNFKAINVTIPYKETVLPYLYKLDAAAKKIQAVNTIVNKNGKLYGYNTDYYGFLYMIKKNKIQVKDKKVIILGNGGACKAVKAVIHDLNAKEIIVTSRKINPDTITIEEAYQKQTNANIIINTTPCGMYPNIQSQAIDLSRFSNLEAVIDIVYNPLNTQLIQQAKKLNIPAISGLEMLVAQAKKALEHFKNIQIDDDKIHQVYLNILSKTTNYIVIDNLQLAQEKALKSNKTLLKLDKENIEKAATSTNCVFLVSRELYNRYKEILSINVI